MNKMTVAVLSLLSVAMFFGIANAGAVPDGFAEVPWGASRAQVEKTMNENGYQQITSTQPGQLKFKGAFAGERCILTFRFIAGSFYDGTATFDMDTHPLIPQRVVKHMVNMISEKYGQPQTRESEKDRTNVTAGLTLEWAKWKLVDSRADKYDITVCLTKGWVSNGTLQYEVYVSYSAQSLSERLKKKGL
jgi:hypothetical protein